MLLCLHICLQSRRLLLISLKIFPGGSAQELFNCLIYGKDTIPLLSSNSGHSYTKETAFGNTPSTIDTLANFDKQQLELTIATFFSNHIPQTHNKANNWWYLYPSGTRLLNVKLLWRYSSRTLEVLTAVP